MTHDLIIIGCGGFGREVVGIVDAVNAAGTTPAWNLLGFADDAPSADHVARLGRIGVAFLGTTTQVGSLLEDGRTRLIIGAGMPHVRRTIAERISRPDSQFATLVDPTARVGRDVRLGHGAIIAAAAHVTTNVDIGDHVHIDRGVQVGHDSTIGSFSTAHPGSVISGACNLGRAVQVGTSATVLPERVVGDGAVIGAASCVTRDVPAGSTVAGVPARII